MKLSSFQRRLRVFIKRFVYSQLYLRESLFIILGKSRPLVRFTVEESPPSLYLNFAVREDRLADFERELALPYPLAPISCLEDEAPFHCLTLNVYRVSGLANGIRAEWSAYIRDASGKPRYMIVEAQADAGSMDPIHLITRPGSVTHEQRDGALLSDVTASDGSHFVSRVPYTGDEGLTSASQAWIEANDLIYWRNGICDRTFYDAGLAGATTRLLDASKVEIRDDTPWARFIDPEPKHVVVFENAIEFAMSPWWNLDEIAIPTGSEDSR